LFNINQTNITNRIAIGTRIDIPGKSPI